MQYQTRHARPNKINKHGPRQNVSVAIVVGKRPDPFRTRKLSQPTPMVLHPGGCGRVGHRRPQTNKNRLLNQPFRSRFLSHTHIDRVNAEFTSGVQPAMRRLYNMTKTQKHSHLPAGLWFVWVVVYCCFHRIGGWLASFVVYWFVVWLLAGF